MSRFFLVTLAALGLALACGADPTALETQDGTLLYAAPDLVVPQMPVAEAEDATELVAWWRNHVTITCGQCHHVVENPSVLRHPFGPRASADDAIALIDRWKHRVVVRCASCHVDTIVDPEILGIPGPAATAEESAGLIGRWRHLHQSDCMTCHAQPAPETEPIGTDAVIRSAPRYDGLLEAGYLNEDDVRAKGWCLSCHPDTDSTRIRPFLLDKAHLRTTTSPVGPGQVHPDGWGEGKPTLLELYHRYIPRERWPDLGPPPPPNL